MTESIPEKCLACPRLEVALKRIALKEYEQNGIIHSALDPDLDAIAEEMTTQIESYPEEFAENLGMSPEDPKRVVNLLRQVGGMAMEFNKRDIQEIEHDMVHLAEWCRGPITLSTTDHGIDYHATVCGSIILLEEDEDALEPVVVKRYEIID